MFKCNYACENTNHYEVGVVYSLVPVPSVVVVGSSSLSLDGDAGSPFGGVVLDLDAEVVSVAWAVVEVEPEPDGMEPEPDWMSLPVSKITSSCEELCGY